MGFRLKRGGALAGSLLSLLGLMIAGLLLLFYSRELFGVDVLKNFFLQQLETSLRRKIEVNPETPRLIKTVRGVGYVLRREPGAA